MNSGLWRGLSPSLRKLRLISKTLSKPPTTSRLRYNSGAMRRKSGMSSALWCVAKGLAVAPPGIGCIIGVSTSRKPWCTMKLRIDCTMRLRTAKVKRDCSLVIRST